MVRDCVSNEVPAVHNLDEAPIAVEREGFSQTVFRGMDQMIAVTRIGPDHEDRPTHSHSWEQVNVLVEGNIDFVVGDERVSLEPYDAFVIPPGVEHASRVTSEETAKMMVHWPLREDRLDATEYQQEFEV